MKKILFLLLTMVLCMNFFSVVSFAEAKEAIFLYVATDGNDSNSGTISSPLATISAAISAAKQKEGQVVIQVRGGTYPITDTISLDRNDLVIRNYQDETAVLTGGNDLAYSGFKSISADAAKRLLDQKAASKVLEFDMKQAGITEYGRLDGTDRGISANPNAPALYINGQRMTLSRYPNDEYLMTGKVVQKGVGAPLPSPSEITDDQLYKFECSDSRIKKWSQAEDIWMFGYFVHDWSESRVGALIDEAKGVVTAKYIPSYGLVENRRFYFYNLLEEVDQPGEWYLDRTNGMLYVYPTQDFNASAQIEYVTFSKPFFDVNNCKNVTLQGLTLKTSAGNGIIGKNIEQFVVNDCKLINLGGSGIVLSDAKDSSVKNSNLYNMGAKGVSIGGGDRLTLTPGNNTIENNNIEKFGQIMTTYQSGASVSGVGNVIKNNAIHDAPHMAVGYGGNNHIVEYNEIYNVCKDTSDSGAIYVGRDWSTQGNFIRYNYFHDLKMTNVTTTFEMQAVYLDDMHSSTQVHGNVFYKVDSVALFGGGPYNTFVNNLMLECAKPFVYDSRGTGWATAQEWMNPNSEKSLYFKLKAFPYNEGVWLEQYPYLKNFLEDEPELPKYAIIKNNVEYKSAGYELHENVTQYGTVENNITVSGTSSFADYKNKDFSVLPDSEITKKIPDWEEIPMEKIGTQEYTVEDEYVEKAGEVVLAIGTANAFVNGEKTLIDPANSAVQPIVQNDRTLVPVRFIAESFGAKVDWEEDTQTVTITLGDTVTKLVIGENQMQVGERVVVLDVPAQTQNDRTLLPLRAICEEVLGKTVFWDEVGLIVITDGPVEVNVADWMSRLTQ